MSTPSIFATETSGGLPPIADLQPESRKHNKLLNHLLRLLDGSEEEMSRFYSRWRANEMRAQAFITLPDYEKIIKTMNNDGKPPKITSITVPHIFATISTIVTYLIHTFAGHRPIFQIGASKAESEQAARMMELVLQYNADHIRLVRRFFQFFHDAELYGVGVMRTQWTTEFKSRTIQMPTPTTVLGIGVPGTEEMFPTTQRRLVFEGTDVQSVDPFLFFPDPRVPMNEANRRGEYVFWRTFEGRHMLKKAEADGLVHFIDAVPEHVVRPRFEGTSARSALVGGEPQPGDQTDGRYAKANLANYVQIDQGTVEIVPADFGLNDSTLPEKWLFSVGNRKQIIQAQPFKSDHDMHPVVVAEPYSLGYGFGQPGVSDYLAPIQDALSWFINSHVYNVRTALNNMFVVDPTAINVPDLQKPEPGKIIRLKDQAIGKDVRSVIQQLGVTDVTQSHISDAQVFLRMGDALSAVTDNLRGVQQAGGRKTATEVRVSGESAVSRLAAQAKKYSAQSMTDLTEQMTLNAMQFLSQAFYLNIVGIEGITTPLTISPGMIQGDFDYPVHDGTLPLDKVAMVDTWKELLITVSQDPNLSQRYDAGAMFEWIAQLSGAKNLSRFKVAPNEAMQQQATAGNMVPLEELQSLGG